MNYRVRGGQELDDLVNHVFLEHVPCLLRLADPQDPSKGFTLNGPQFKIALNEMVYRYIQLQNKPGQQATNPNTMQQDGQVTQELTFGEKLVGKTFNPSGDDKVARLKALAAEMSDIVAA